MDSPGDGVLHRHRLWMLILSLCLFPKIYCQISLSDVFLNAPHYCGHDKTNGVSTRKGYLIKPDLSPHVRTTSFRNCEVTFHSEKYDGRVCLSQEGKLAEILDNNAMLTAYDGASDAGQKVFRIEYGPDKWNKREYCTNTAYLYMYLEKKDQTKATDIRQLHMLFKVQDIRSTDRIFYLEENYCDQKYELENSQIMMVNRLPYNSPVPVRKVKDLCLMELERKKNDSLRTCIVYQPSEKGVSCGKGWEIFISNDKQNALDPATHVHTMKCDDPLAQETHAWCAKNTSNSLYFYLSRQNTNLMSDSEEEPPGMFSFVVADYSGSEEDLIDLLKVQKSMRQNSVSKGMPTYLIAVIAAAAVVVVVISLMIFRKCRDQYNKVPINSTDKEIVADDDRKSSKPDSYPA